MLDGLDLDPHDVLGVPEGCTPEALRDAYHGKSKKHHPDHGGDAWAFRIVTRAYAALQQTLDRERMIAKARQVPDTGRMRPGVYDKDVAPERLVHVEVVWMRYDVGDLLLFLGERGEDRNLSGTIQIDWPGPDFAEAAGSIVPAERILKALNAAFDELRQKTGPDAARSRIEDGRFQATLGYPSGQVASEAFKLLHVGLKARGLGVKQWTRDVAIPRE